MFGIVQVKLQNGSTDFFEPSCSSSFPSHYHVLLAINAYSFSGLPYHNFNARSCTSKLMRTGPMIQKVEYVQKCLYNVCISAKGDFFYEEREVWVGRQALL